MWPPDADLTPLGLDPFSPIGISPIADIAAPTDPLSIEPLSPPSAHGVLLRHLQQQEGTS
jgi:hypothetical protein